MLTQIFIGAVLILTTVVVHAIRLELILKVLFSVRMEVKVGVDRLRSRPTAAVET